MHHHEIHGSDLPCRILGWLTDADSGLRVHHGLVVFKALASSTVGRYVAWDFMRNSFPQIVDM